MVTFFDRDPLQAEDVDALLLRELTALLLEAMPADLVAHTLATGGECPPRRRLTAGSRVRVGTSFRSGAGWRERDEGLRDD